MRLRWSSGRRLMAPATRIAAGFRRMMGAPLRRPRMTTRLLMLVVAIVAIGIWAVMDVPQAIDRALVYRGKAGFHAELERRSRDMERDRSTRARAIQSEFDQWRRDGGSADQLTEHYFASRLEFYVIDAEYQREMATYHANLKNQYRWARWFPFVPAAREIAPPPDPLQSPALAHEPGKTYEIVAEGGVSVAFSPVGAGLAVGCRDKTIKLLELPSRRMRASFPLGAGEPDSVVFSPDGATLLAAGDRQFVRRWDVATGRAGRPIPWIGQSPGQPGTFMFASAVGCSPDGGTIAVAGERSLGKPSKEIAVVRLFDTRTGALKWEHKATANVPRSVSFSPDGETLAFGNGAAVLLDTRTGNVKKTLKPAIGHVIAVAYSPDGQILAGAGADTVAPGVGFPRNGRVTLWDVSTGTILRTLEGPTGDAVSVAFSPDGRTVAAGGTGPPRTVWDRLVDRRVSSEVSEVRLWDVAMGRPIWTAEGEFNAACSLTFSPDGKSLGFCDENYVYIIDAGTGRLKQIVMETISKSRVRDRAPATATAIPPGRSSGGE